jgi:serine/threonine protein kinase/tetratricopeptide (TPR) repeat protein
MTSSGVVAAPPSQAPDAVTLGARAASAQARAQGQPSPVDRAYSEYCRQYDAGIAPDIDEYCACFPDIRESLAEILEAHRHFQENPDFLEAPIAWPEPGAEFLGYRLQSELGRGAFSRVFLAQERALGDRPVVVKLSRWGAAEAQTLGRLGHPNIVPVFSVQVEERSRLCAVCMPFLGAATFCDLLNRVLLEPTLPTNAATILEVAGKGSTAPVDQAESALQGLSYVDGIRRLAVQVLEALAFIHAEGVCHRDLKPSNVLLTRAGAPMLLDFNLSRDARQIDRRFGGTPIYTAPEQLRLLGRRPGDPATLDGRSDLYSLGVILFELLTCKHPFTPPPADTPLEQIKVVLLERQALGAPPIRSENPAVDPHLAELVDHCLAFQPADRPVSAQAALAMLTPPATRLGRLRRRLTRPAAIAVALLLAAVCGLLMPMMLPGTNHRTLAEQAYRRHDYQQVVDHLNEHLRAQHDDADGRFLRGAALLKLGETPASDGADASRLFALAVNDLTLAHSLRPSPVTQACLGYAYQRGDHWNDQACLCYTHAINEGYKTAAVLNNRGYAWMQTNALTEALADFNQAITLDPNQPVAYYNRAGVHVGMYLKYSRGKTRGAAPRGVRDQHLTAAMDDFARVIALARDLEITPSAEFYRDAALPCVYLSVENPALAGTAVEYLALAIAQGLPLNSVQHAPFDRLKTHPDYPSLLRVTPVTDPHVAAEHLLPIVPQ